MRKLRSLLVALACVLAFAPAITVSAAPSSNFQNYASVGYMYTIRIYPGAQGYFENGVSYIAIKAPAGMIIGADYLNERLEANGFQLKNGVDSKYYKKGLREAGKDNNDAANAFTFRAEQDIDYVIAYGMKGGDVAYTINYLDNEGNELMPAETHYGNEGDKPVIAFKYIEGYVPQALNLTKTLDADASKNVFTFRYVKGDSSRYGRLIIDNGEVVTYADGGVLYEYIPGQVTNNGGQVNVVNQGGEGGEGAPAEQGGETTAITEETAPVASAPVQIVDLDDEGVALADGLNEGGFGKGFDYKDAAVQVGFQALPTALKGVIIASIVALIGALAYGVVRIVQKSNEAKAEKAEK